MLNISVINLFILLTIHCSYVSGQRETINRSKSKPLLTLEENNIIKCREHITALEECGMPPSDGSGQIDPRIGSPHSVSSSTNDDEPCAGRTLEGLINVERAQIGQTERNRIFASALESVKLVNSYSSIAEMIEAKLRSVTSASSAASSTKLWFTFVGAKNAFSGNTKSISSAEYITFTLSGLKIHVFSVNVPGTRPDTSAALNQGQGQGCATVVPPINSGNPKIRPENTTDTGHSNGGNWRPGGSKQQSGDTVFEGEPNIWTSDFEEPVNSYIISSLKQVTRPVVGVKMSADKVCQALINKLALKYEETVDPRSWACFAGPLHGSAFRSYTSEIPMIRMKMGVAKVRVMKMPKISKIETEAIIETRLNINSVSVNNTNFDEESAQAVVAFAQEGIQNYSSYAGIAKFIQDSAGRRWSRKFHVTVGLDTQYWIYFWFKKPYLINFTINELRIIVYSQN